MEDVQFHELMHVVRIDYPEDDGIPDFLAIDDLDGIPDTVYLRFDIYFYMVHIQ